MARPSQKDMQDEIDRNKARITALEEELKQSRSNEKSLEDKVKSLEKEIQDLKDKNEDLAKKLQELEGQIAELRNENEIQKGEIKELKDESEVQKAQKQHDDCVLILVQIGLDIQRNMCKYVLGKCFKNWRYYKFKEINSYIDEIEQPDDKDSANARLEEFTTEISWNPNLVDSLKNFNQRRISIAHPELSSEKIQKATDFLREKGELDEEMVGNINKLKEQWEISKSFLEKISAEALGGPRNAPRKVPITGQKHGRDANKVVNGCPRKRPRKS